MPVSTVLRGRLKIPLLVKLASTNSLHPINGLRKIPTVNNSGISRWYK
jgi:hypothetical protein